jgi:hypothetical protein
MQCVQEVEDNAVLFRQTGIIPALEYGIYKSDTLLSPSVKSSLQASLRRLEWTSRRDKSLCSAGLETRIVDPYLYPLIFGRTKIVNCPFHNPDDSITLCGQGSSGISWSPQDQDYGSLNGGERFCGDTSYMFRNAWSVRYQWLPCGVDFELETGKAR